MGYSTPATAVAGTALTAAYLNTYVRDNIAWIATDSPTCRAYNSADFGVANATATAITMNSERFDNAAMHSTSVNTDRITIPTGGAGKYILGGALQWQINATGTRIIEFLVNGLTNIGEQSSLATAAVAPIVSVCTVYALAAADYVTMVGYQDSTGGLNVLSGPNISPEAWLFWFRT